MNWKLSSHKFIVLIVTLSLLTLFALPTFAQDDGDDGNTGLYTVQSGDTLQDIADRFNTTIEALMQLNLITNASYLSIGQVLIIPPTGGAFNGTPAQATTLIHVIQPRETLMGIADFYDTTIEALMETNDITNQNQLYIGQTLIIPAQGGSELTEPVQTTDVTTTNTVTATQPQQQIQTQPITVRQIFNGRYTVQLGDTLFAISRAFNVDMWNIARANGIYNLSWIYAGQSLIIPGY